MNVCMFQKFYFSFFTFSRMRGRRNRNINMSILSRIEKGEEVCRVMRNLLLMFLFSD